MRAALLQLNHEANAFVPEHITLADFHARHFCAGEDVRTRFGQTKNWLGGVLQGLDEARAQVEIGVCTASHPGGPVDRASFERLCADVLGSLREIRGRGPVDLVVLLLHGALAVQGVAEPEGDLAWAVRDIVGPDTVIATPLDFHANVNPSLVAAVDVLIGGKLYPHTDTRERGARLARLGLARVADGRRHDSAHFRLPLMVPMPRQTTFEGPFETLAALTEVLEQRFGLDDVTLLGGFPFADTSYAGTSVLISGGTPGARREAFRELAAEVWTLRAALLEPVEVFPAVVETIRRRAQSGRLVVADAGDNPGGGGIGDNVDLLEALIGLDLPFAAGFIVDADAARLAAEAGVGQSLSLNLGQRGAGGGLEVTATVLRSGEVRYRNAGAMMTGELLEGGLGAVLQIGAGEVVVTSAHIQAYDTQGFLSQGVALAEKRIILVKSTAHFRPSYTPFAEAGILLADSRGWSSSDPTRFAYTGRLNRILPLAALDRTAWQEMVDIESGQAGAE